MFVYFLDENLHGAIFADILKAAGLSVELHKDHFKPGVDDTVWIPGIAQRGWIAVTGDKKTRFRPDEKAAIVKSKAKMIHVINRNSTHPILANNFVNTLTRIEAFLKKTEAPCLATLTRPNLLDAYFRKQPGNLNPQKLDARKGRGGP